MALPATAWPPVSSRISGNDQCTIGDNAEVKLSVCSESPEGGDSEITDFGSDYGPSLVTISYPKNKKIVFESGSDCGWTLTRGKGSEMQ